MDALADRLDGSGVSESVWATSPAIDAIPWATWQSLLLGVDRIVIVAPHPDDEVLGAGGLLQAAAASGVSILVVSVTEGEACYPDDPLWTPALLAKTRTRERDTALGLLGVPLSSSITLRIPDGQVAAHEDVLCARLCRLLNDRDRIVVTWSKDGHPDHEATARAALHAARVIGARTSCFPVWAWHWMDPLAALPLPNARRYPLSDSQLAVKSKALASFVSQRQHPTRPPILPAAVIARFTRSFEVFCDEYC